MKLPTPIHRWLTADTADNLLPDFVLASVFFTALSYAVLSRRFEKQRPAIAMSATLGLALSAGLIWWEQANGYSIRDLGPLAVGFAIILLAFVMYQSVRYIGGSWAGAGFTLAVSILVAQLFGMNLSINTQIVQTVVAIGLLGGLLALTFHHHGHCNTRISGPRIAAHAPDMARLFRERHLSHAIEKRLNGIRERSQDIQQRPQAVRDIQQQIKRMLPAEGYLTERMAELRAKAHRIRHGHIARLDQTKHVFAKLPISARKKASAELAAAYNQIIGVDKRLERLDNAVSENERRIRTLTQKAQRQAAEYDHKGLTESLKHAEKLQRHNSRLFKAIDRTETKFTTVAKRIAAQAKHAE